LRRNSFLHLPRSFSETAKFQILPDQSDGAAAVKRASPPVETVQASSFAIQSRSAAAFQLAALLKLLRKVLKLPGSI
jgi:hypothetical protein